MNKINIKTTNPTTTELIIVTYLDATWMDFMDNLDGLDVNNENFLLRGERFFTLLVEMIFTNKKCNDDIKYTNPMNILAAGIYFE